MKPRLAWAVAAVFGVARLVSAAGVSLGNADVVIDGASAGDRAHAISSAGDVDGDGFGDFLLGASRAGVAPVGGYEPGRAYLIFGGPELPRAIDLASLGDRGIDILPGSEPGWLGYAVAAAGDVNGDGADDFVVSALRAREGGVAYIVFGGAPLPDPLDVSALGNRGVKILGQPRSGLGRSVAGIGDWNDDGYDDVAIGAIEGHTVPPVGGSVGRTHRKTGMVYIILGGPDLPSEIDVDLLDGHGVYVNGVEAHDFFGARVAGVEDFNGDGLPDLVIGAPMADPLGRNLAGESYIVFGRRDPPPVIDIILDLDARIIIRGRAAEDHSGHWVAGAGDINDDGLADAIISAVTADPGGLADAGAAYIVLGSTTPADIDLAAGGGFVTLRGAGPRDRFGSSVDGVGDFDRDGIADIVTGAEEADPQGIKDAGAAWILHGGSSLPATIDVGTIGDSGKRFDGERPFDHAGYVVAGLRDVNGDLVPDVGVAALDASPAGRSGAGRFYVILGPATPSPQGLACTITAGGNQLEWTNPVPFDAIRIERGGVEIATLPGDATSYLDEAIVAGVLTYRVIGIVAGADSLAATCTLSAEVLPPGSLECVVDAGQVSLHWSQRHPSPVDGTRIYRDGELIATVAGDAQSYIDEAAEPGSHTYGVSAILGALESIVVECSIVVPEPVTDLACSADACDVRLTWMNGEEYDAVEVRRNGELVSILETGGLESFVEREVPPGTYTYTVSGRIGSFGGAPATCEVTVIAAITGLVGSAEGDVVTLDWDMAPSADAILVDRDSVPIAELPGDAVTYEDSGVAFGSHEYTVRARLGASVGKPATVVVEVVAPVLDPRACADGTKVTLDWALGDTYDAIQVLSGGETVDTLPGTSTSVQVNADGAGTFRRSIAGVRGNGRSVPVEFTEEVLPAPVDLTAGWADGVLTISWSIPAGAMWDRISVALAGEEKASLPGDATTVDIPLEAVGFVAISVRGIADNADCPSLGIPAETAIAAVDSPRNLVCSALGLAVHLEWENGAGYGGVQILRNGELVATLPGDAVSHDDTVSGPGTYEYRVIGLVEGAPTLPAICSVRIAPAPTGLTCENFGDRIELSWDLGDSVDGVRVFRNGDEIASLPAGATSYVDEAPVVGANSYDVRFATGTNLGVAATCEHTVLPPIGGVVCAADGMTATITWEAGGAYDAVLILRDGVAVGPAGGVPGDQVSFTDTGLTAGEHCYVLQGVTADGVSAPSEPCCVEVLLAPIRLMCSASDAVVRLGWENPRAYDSIEILRDGSVIATLDGGAMLYEDPEAMLDPGTYVFGVRGRVGDDISDVATCEITIAPPVTDLVCRQEGTTIVLEWTPPANAVSITIHRNGQEIASLPGDATGFEDEGLAVNLYNYEVRTVAGTAIGAPVACAVDMIQSVRDLACARMGGDIVLTWTLGDTYDAIVVLRDGERLTDPALPGDATTFTDEGLAPGSHAYEVTAMRGTDTSEPAEVLCIEGPFLASCALEGTEVVLEWDFTGEADEFIITRTRNEDGAEETISVSGDAREHREQIEPGTYEYTVTAVLGASQADSLPCEVVVPAGFIRGEINQDSRRDIADPIFLLNYLWRGGPDVLCLDAADVNDDGELDVSDATYYITWQFSAGPPPRAPFPACGEDPTPDDLDCESFPLIRCP